MREFVLLPYSLQGEVWENFTYWSSMVTPSDTVLTFSGAYDYAVIAGIGENYRAAIASFSHRGIPVREVAEDCLDAFLLAHKSTPDLYLTPTGSDELIVASAVACGYSHNLFALSAADDGPQIKNLAFLVKATKACAHAGYRALDNEPADADHAPGTVCHYTVGGRTYQQILPARTGNSKGKEGYVIPAQDARYCLKIWDGVQRTAFSNEKIEKMLNIKDVHPRIAIPRTFVFNENNHPIGICMPRFEGCLTSLDRLNRHKNGLELCKELLSHMIWMQTRELLHQDIWHNVLLTDSTAYVIDLESAQYLSYPATAASADIVAYVPAQYKKCGMFHSTIEQNYTALVMLVLLYFESREDLGRLLWDRARKAVRVNRQMLTYLPAELQSLVLQAYEKEIPVSLLQQLRFVENQLAYLPDCSPETEYDGDDFFEGYNDSPAMSAEEIDQLIECASEDLCENVYAGPMPAGKKTVSPPPARAPSSTAPAKKPLLVRMLQLLIIRLFGSTSGTIIKSYGDPVDPWEDFIRSKVWKKPIAVSAVTGVLILILLIAIAAM